MQNDAIQIRANRRKERDAYLVGLSDRTRALCLGSLALVWGLVTQKEGGSGVHVSRPARIALLGVGLSAIVVLVLDFGEYASAFQYRRKLAGEKVGKIRYGKWENLMRFSKIIVGALTLVALVVVLARVLAASVFAKEAPQYPYYGLWCGDAVSYTCLEVTKPKLWDVVEVSFGNGSITCTDVTQEGVTQEGDVVLKATCNDTTIRISPGGNETEVKMYLESGGSNDTRWLELQPE